MKVDINIMAVYINNNSAGSMGLSCNGRVAMSSRQQLIKNGLYRGICQQRKSTEGMHATGNKSQKILSDHKNIDYSKWWLNT